MKAAAGRELFADEPDVAAADGVAVVLEEGRAGLLVVGENSTAGGAGEFEVLVDDDTAPDSTVLDAGDAKPTTIHADAPLSEAADRMILHSIGRLPVVDESEPPRLCGLLTRREVLQARQHRIDAEKRG